MIVYHTADNNSRYMILNKDALEVREAKMLMSYAVKSRESKGRTYDEIGYNNRLCFQLDRDRVVHCKAFRRLEAKTQVLIAGSGDHYRTRLTHTLEVAQVSRDVARRLGLNEDLCETIALAHDLGHPPFGHGGEEALDEMMKKYGSSFEHNQQSRRIVEDLEKLYPNFEGLNLTFEVLDGLTKHQSAWDQAGKKFEILSHIEAQVVNIADEIAYTNHDMDDGIRSGLISVDELESFEIWQIALEKVLEQYGELTSDVLVSRVISKIISIMVDDLCEQTNKNIIEFGIMTLSDVYNHKGHIASFSPKIKIMVKALREFLFKNFYMSNAVSERVEDGKTMIKKLFDFYLAHPEKMSLKVHNKKDASVILLVKDYIAGMTDVFLIAEFNRHF